MGHSHHHHHSTGDSSDRIGIAFLLNLAFTVIEFIGGLLTNSTAILADAVHDLGDSLSLGMGWVLARLSRREADSQYTYGPLRLSLLAALINGMVLLAGCTWVLLEAVPRLMAPEMPHAPGMAALAVLGITVNGYAAWRLSAGQSMNERVLNWHLLEDVLGWIAVLLVSIALLFVDLPILDPLLSIGFTLFILFNVARNLTCTVKLFLQAVPDPELHSVIERQLQSLPAVEAVHHLHLWSLDGDRHVLTAHLVLSRILGSEEQRQLKAEIATRLAAHDLAHTTIELEQPSEPCRDEPAG